MRCAAQTQRGGAAQRCGERQVLDAAAERAEQSTPATEHTIDSLFQPAVYQKEWRPEEIEGSGDGVQIKLPTYPIFSNLLKDVFST